MRNLHNYILVCILSLLLFSCNNSGDNVNHRSCPVSEDGYLKRGDSLLKATLYDSALFYYNLALDKHQTNKSWERYVTTLLKITDIYRLKGKSDLAVKTIISADSILIANHLNSYKIQSDILHKKGLLLIEKGAFDSAINIVNSSINIKSKHVGRTDSSLALNYNVLGTAYFYKVDFNNALKNYTRAYELALLRKNPEDADLAMYLQNIGIINAQKGEYDKAENAFTASLAIQKKLLKSNDPELAMIYLNLGRLKALLNKDLEAMSLYNQVENILIKNTSSNHQYFNYLYQNKGQTYVHMADYEKALVYFNKALVVASESFNANHPQILSLNMNIGYVHEKKGDYTNALKYYLSSIPEGSETPSLVKTYGNLASLFNAMKNHSKSMEFFTKAISLSERLLGEDHPETGLLYSKFGYYLISNNNKSQGVILVRKALEINKKRYGLKSREVSNNLTQIGNYHLSNDEYEKALEFFQKAIIALVKNFNDLKSIDNPEIDSIEADRYLVNALNGKAHVLSLLGGKTNLINSLNTYKLSVKVIDKLRATYQDEESKLLISADEKRTFQLTVNTAIKLYELTKNKSYLAVAFDYSDKSKSAVLINSIHEVEAQHFGKIPSTILASERKLKLDLGTFRRFIYEEKQKPSPNNEMINLWESKVFSLTVRYDSLVDYLEKNYPEYHDLKYKEPKVNISSIQHSLGKDKTLVEYMLSDSTLSMFAINEKDFEVYTSKIDSQFYKDIETLAFLTTNNSLLSTSFNDYVKYSIASHSLYKRLIEPLKTKFNDKKLVIIPDGELGYLSFDMLLSKIPDTTTMDFRNLDYLIKDKVLSYSTSAVLQFSDFRKRERNPSRNVLAMAPSYDNLVNNKNSATRDDKGRLVNLLPIPGVEKEIEGIKRSISITDITGKAATERKFKREVEKYNILHLAMHTIMSSSQPMLSKLVFYQDNDTIEDGMLNTYELFSMNLNAGLAVLSACNTGTGKLIKGEGIMSLARGFIFSGVPSIVMTMWSVEDQSSVSIVENFYKYLEDGLPKDEALRQAKLDFLAQGDPLKSHPFYWAAYVNIGDSSPMKFSPNYLSYSIAGTSLLSLIFVLLYLKRRKKKNKTRKHAYVA